MVRPSTVAGSLVTGAAGLGALIGYAAGAGPDLGAAAGAITGATLAGLGLLAHYGGSHTATESRHDVTPTSEPQEQSNVVVRHPDGSVSMGVPYYPAYGNVPAGYGQHHVSLPVAREHARQVIARERRRAAVRDVLGRSMDIDTATIVRNPIHRLHSS